MSLALIAAIALHQPHALPRHRLPSLLGEAFSASTGLVDVDVVRLPRDHAIHPNARRCVAELNAAGAANRAAALDDHRKCHSIAEVQDLLQLDLELLVSVQPILKEATDLGRTLVRA